MKIESLKLQPHKILLKKCENDSGNIVTSDKIKEWCNWAIIQDIGDCEDIDETCIGNAMNLPDRAFRWYEVFVAEDEFGDMEKFVILDERLLRKRNPRISPLMIVMEG